VKSKSLELPARQIPYKEVIPPFSIKTRGSVLLIYDLNADSYDWHSYARPSIVQELAASGHRTIAVGLEHLWKQSEALDLLIDQLNLTNCVLILPALAKTDVDLLKFMESKSSLDAVIYIAPEKTPPIFVKTIVIAEKISDDLPDDPNVQLVIVKAPLRNGNQDAVMQVIANFLDFIHPR
jgi:hypothetical protein